MKKIILALVLALILTVGACVAISAEADATNDTAENAVAIELGSNYSGTLTQDSRKDWYSFTMPASGRLDINVMTTMGSTGYYIYDSNQTRVWGSTYSNGLNTELHLVAGKYYFFVERSSYYGDYSFSLTFTPADETFAEEIGSLNNNINTASSINFDTSYKGQIAQNDLQDYYKIVVPESGRINIKVTTTMGRTYYRLYNESNVRLYETYPSNGMEKETYLVAGTYYFEVCRCDVYGNYSFVVEYKSSGESFEENHTTNNNNIEKASEISFGTEYKGQLALNDTTDYYKFTMEESGLINIKATTTMGRTYYRLYNSSNVRIFETYPSNGVDKELHLIAGTYYLEVCKLDDYGNYTFGVTFKKSGESFEENSVQNNNSIDDASDISFGAEYKGQLALNDTTDYYKIAMGESGAISIKVNTTMGRTYYRIYNSSNVRIFETYPSNGLNTEIHLIAGTYYLEVCKLDDYGNYTFGVVFKTSGESFAENSLMNNNTFEDASDINLGTEYKGQLAYNDENDYYKFIISDSGRISLKVSTAIGRTYYRIYNESNVRLLEFYPSGGIDQSIFLTAGTYYLQVCQLDGLGNYTMKLGFESAGESFAESTDINNNSMEDASPVVLGTEYKGQLAANDHIDYYSFTITTPQKITVSVTAALDWTGYYIYDSNNSIVWRGSGSNGTLGDTEILPAGTYYFVVELDDEYGNYTFKLLEQHDCNMDGVRETKGTCTQAGMVEKYCTVCNKVVSTEYTDYSHAWGEWTNEAQASCESGGSRFRECSLCHETEYEDVPALDHEYKDGFCIRCEQAQYSSDNYSDEGCFAVVGSSAVVAVIAIIGAAVVLRKKED